MAASISARLRAGPLYPAQPTRSFKVAAGRFLGSAGSCKSVLMVDDFTGNLATMPKEWLRAGRNTVSHPHLARYRISARPGIRAQPTRRNRHDPRQAPDRRAFLYQEPRAVSGDVPALDRGAGGVLARGGRDPLLVPPAPRRHGHRPTGSRLLLVLGRPAQRLLQLRRPPPAGARRADRHHLGRR